jgi:hypothetical protein
VVFTTPHEDRTAGRSFGPRVPVSVGATALMLGSAGFAVWRYRRARRAQARPIYRLQSASTRLVRSLRKEYPLGSGALGGAMLLGVLTLARWLARGDTQRTERAQSTTTRRAAWGSAEQFRGMLPTMDDLATWRQTVRGRRR